MLDAGPLHRLTRAICRALADDEPVGPLALAWLLDRYAVSADDELGAALGRGLAAALETARADAPPRQRASWARLFARATICSEDLRVAETAGELADWLFRTTRQSGTTEPWLLDAALDVSRRLVRRDLLATAIDALETLVAGRYSPGEGLLGSLDDQIASTLALLAAFVQTERVPYAMLAEELMHGAFRTSWQDAPGAFHPQPADAAIDVFTLNCHAVRAWCRLARLEHSPLYQAYAVANRTAEYLAHAESALVSQAGEASGRGAGAAVFGLALADWLDLK